MPDLTPTPPPLVRARLRLRWARRRARYTLGGWLRSAGNRLAPPAPVIARANAAGQLVLTEAGERLRQDLRDRSTVSGRHLGLVGPDGEARDLPGGYERIEAGGRALLGVVPAGIAQGRADLALTHAARTVDDAQTPAPGAHDLPGRRVPDAVAGALHGTPEPQRCAATIWPAHASGWGPCPGVVLRGRCTAYGSQHDDVNRADA